MPPILPTVYVGSAAAAILLPDGKETRIYYQGADGAIHEAKGTGPATSGAVYTDRVVVPASEVRPNSPIAAITWTQRGDGLQEIRIYFVDQSNILREKWSITTETIFQEGELSLKKYQVQINSGVLYALVGPPGGWSLRVGYQAARAPNAITEASHINGIWDEKAFA